MQAPDIGDDDSDDDDDSTVRSRLDGSPSLKRNELQTYDSSASSNAGPLAGGLAIPSAAPKPDDPGGRACWSTAYLFSSFLCRYVLAMSHEVHVVA